MGIETLLLGCGLLAGPGVSAQTPAQTNYLRGTPVELNDNGAWSWFMDERAIVDRGHLLAGSVRANGKFKDSDRPGWVNVELAVYEVQTREVKRIVLHEHLEQDEHDAPGLWFCRTAVTWRLIPSTARNHAFGTAFRSGRVTQQTGKPQVRSARPG